jgi:hypothetical protein
MRTTFLCLLILAAACAMHDETGYFDGAVTAPGDVEISLRPEVAEGRPILAVTIVNRSSQPICLGTEALQNPYSGEMHLELRDDRGRSVGYRPSDLIPPPLPGTTRVEPGEIVAGRDYLGRFRRRPPRTGSGWTAQAAFRYGYCSDVSSLIARSGWQPI